MPDRCIVLTLAALVSGCAPLGGLTGGGGDAGPPDARPAVDASPRADAHDATPRDAHEAHEALDAPRVTPPGGAIMVASGASMSLWCAVTQEGNVECWGDNEVGALGNGSTKSSMTPVRVAGLPPATAVAVGAATAYALTKSGAVWAWGYGHEGQLGNGGTSLAQTSPVPVTGLTSGVTSIAAGGYTACAVKTDGSAWCWGDGAFETLGNGTTDTALVPVQVTGLSSGVSAISVGSASACAVQTGGVVCWGGLDGLGELGNGGTGDSPTPVPVTALSSGVKGVSVGDGLACALTTSGGVQCWGNGANGALGNGQFGVSPVPVQVAGLSTGVTLVSAGVACVTALKDDGTVVAWGFGEDGELGVGPADFGGNIGYESAVPVKVKGLPGTVVSLSTGAAPCVAIASGEVDCWGITSEAALNPVPVTDLTNDAVSVAVGGFLSAEEFACAVATDGTVHCWGGNSDGQLGNGTLADNSIPSSTPAVVGGATSVSAGVASNYGCAVTSGLVQCWGDNATGMLGNNSTTSSPGPVAVQGIEGSAVAVSAGADSACALTATGAVYCWGDNTYGELGNNSTASAQVAVPVSGITGATAVSVGIDFACAILMDSTIDCWGNNANGELGNGSTSISPVPVPATGVTGATSLSAGWFAACAVTSGTVMCWGDNTYGELGTLGTSSSLVPVSVASITGGATSVAMGQNTACAIVGGGAQCWGSSGACQGNGSELFYSPTPTPVTGLSSGVTSLAVGSFAACAVVNGGAVCWGFNFAGEIGNGGATNAILPTPVPGFP